MKYVILIAILAGVCGSASAQDLRDFCAERPGKATPACILDAGHAQVETGLADVVFQRGGGSRQTTASLAATEVRYGLSRTTEIEAAWSPLMLDHVRGEGRSTGVGDVVLGLRHALTDPDAGSAAVAIQGFISAPTATHGLGAGGWTGGVRLPFSAPIGALDGGGTLEVDVARDADSRGQHLALQGAAGISHGFGPFTAGAELWAMRDEDPAHHAWEASADLTAALAVGRNAQVDAGVNLGLNRATPDVEIYAGIARRF